MTHKPAYMILHKLHPSLIWLVSSSAGSNLTLMFLSEQKHPDWNVSVSSPHSDKKHQPQQKLLASFSFLMQKKIKYWNKNYSEMTAIFPLFAYIFRKFFDPFLSFCPVHRWHHHSNNRGTAKAQPGSYKTEQPQKSLRRVREEPQKNQQPAGVEPFPSSPELRKPPKQKSPVNPGQGVFQTLTYILHSTLELCVCVYISAPLVLLITGWRVTWPL